jgi:hypothetical protein
MTKTSNGAFKYVSGWYDPDILPGSVVATYDGPSTGPGTNAQLVISHGCRPFNQGAWCSPGFWGHAEDAAWALIGVDKATATFGGTVAIDPDFTATNSIKVAAINPDLLSKVLNPATPAENQKYKGAPIGTFKGWAENAFNLTGAWLTDQIPGYTFDPALVSGNESDTCPIDHHGNFKNP